LAPADSQATRLAGLARVWGQVKYVHPAMATSRIDWDAALIRAVPAVENAATVADYRRAISGLLAELHDPVTRVIEKEPADPTPPAVSAPLEVRLEAIDAETAVVTIPNDPSNLGGCLIVILGQAGIGRTASADSPRVSELLEWNQIFIDTLIATNTANSSSQRLGAIVHTAIFDSYNGIERRYTPIFVHDRAPHGASRRAAVIAAAYTALVGLFPSQQAALDARYAASLAALSDDGEDGGQSRECGIEWGTWVAQAVLAWRATDGFSASYPPFTGGTGVGQWRPTPPAFGAMSAQGLAFTAMFVLTSNNQFKPGPPRSLTSARYTDDFDAVKALGRKTGSTRTADQTALAPFWEGNASIHWNQAANQIARQPPVHVQEQPAARGPERRDGRHGFHHVGRQAILRRRFDRGDLAAGDCDSTCGHRRQSGHGP
jgi:hypothetical protein